MILYVHYTYQLNIKGILLSMMLIKFVDLNKDHFSCVPNEGRRGKNWTKKHGLDTLLAINNIFNGDCLHCLLSFLFIPYTYFCCSHFLLQIQNLSDSKSFVDDVTAEKKAKGVTFFA